MKWLEKIHARILSDQSPLPPLAPRVEGTGAIGNIVANQICLLPSSSDCTETPTRTSVDKVIVCGSEVLERYCASSSAQPYIEDITEICVASAQQPTKSLVSAIRARVETECGKSDFHHVFTELAFLEVRKSSLSEEHGMVPVVLSQVNAGDAPMKYLPAIFSSTDVKLKLKSPRTDLLHKLYFKILQRLFPGDTDFIQPFRECYDLASEDLRLDDMALVSPGKLDNVINQRVTAAYQRYWKVFCVLVRNEKLQSYAGKLSDHVALVMEEVARSTRHKILEWLSPEPASKHHGKYHDLGTSRLEGTCDWVIQHEQFRRWHSHQGSALLLLCGNSK